MKRIVIVLLAVLAAVNVSAQDLRFGVAGGVNFSWEYEKVLGEKLVSDSYIGFQAGVKAEMDFSDRITDGFYLVGSVLYSLKGGSYSGTHTNLGFLHRITFSETGHSNRLHIVGDQDLLQFATAIEC